MAPPAPGRPPGTRTFLAGFWLVKAGNALWIGLVEPSVSEPGQHWHIPSNQLAKVNEQLVRGWEDIFFGTEYAASAGTPLPEDAVNYYIDRLASDPEALHGTFQLYRAFPPPSRRTSSARPGG